MEWENLLDGRAVQSLPDGSTTGIEFRFSFGNNNNSSERHSVRVSQHSASISALEAAGWTVESVVLHVGYAGSVFQPAMDSHFFGCVSACCDSLSSSPVPSCSSHMSLPYLRSSSSESQPSTSSQFRHSLNFFFLFCVMAATFRK